MPVSGLAQSIVVESVGASDTPEASNVPWSVVDPTMEHFRGQDERVVEIKVQCGAEGLLPR